jgi:LysM repeat protein
MSRHHLILIGLLLATFLMGCLLLEPDNTPLTLPTTVVTVPVSTDTPAPILATETAVPPTPLPLSTDTPVPLPTATPAPYIEHTVQSGENLASLASQYGISSEAIAAASYLANPDVVNVGQVLTIPQIVAGQTAEFGFTTLAPSAANSPTTIGYSYLGRPIEVYTFGSGGHKLLFVGAIHGGYEWNTAVLAYQIIDLLTANPDLIPASVTVYVIPAANPDGVYAVTRKNGRIAPADILYSNIDDTIPARFNARAVDLNRNWDCQWSPTAFWRDRPVSGGTSPVSEVENQVLRSFLLQEQANLEAVVFWHSQATLVSPGTCDTPHQPSIEMATIYAQTAGYPMQAFSAYEVTGDVSNWLAKIDVPSFTVELTTHEAIDWDRNRAGLEALLTLYED